MRRQREGGRVMRVAVGCSPKQVERLNDALPLVSAPVLERA
jgi:hypothetical protein